MSNKKWSVVAKDYDAPFFRNHIWTRGMTRYTEFLGTDNITIGTTGKNGDMEYIVVTETWAEVHKQFKAKLLKDDSFIEMLITKGLTLGKETNMWSQKNIHEADLTKATPHELITLLKEVYNRQEELYAFGTSIVVFDFQEFSFIEGNLKKIIKQIPERERDECFSVFTEPIRNSFQQDQEEDLLKLMQKWIHKEEWKITIQQKSLEEIQEKFPKFYKKIQEHTEKHCWVYYVYAGPAFTEKDFLNFMIDDLKKRIDPSKKLQELNEKKQRIRTLKEKYLKELQPTAFEKKILKLAGEMVWAKPRRKDLQSKTYYHFEKLQREIGKRLNLSLKEIRSMPREDIEEALTTGQIEKEKIKGIMQCYVVIPNEKTEVEILWGERAEEFCRKNVQESNQKVKQTTTIKGACACKGKVRGIVKIINKQEDMDKMNEGDILVSAATTPNIIAAMKKAAAFVTDEGGLTCHASIVSRELNTPCVVGTKIATKVLKDGDQVEVDANNGIVRIL